MPHSPHYRATKAGTWDITGRIPAGLSNPDDDKRRFLLQWPKLPNSHRGPNPLPTAQPASNTRSAQHSRQRRRRHFQPTVPSGSDLALCPGPLPCRPNHLFPPPGHLSLGRVSRVIRGSIAKLLGYFQQKRGFSHLPRPAQNLNAPLRCLSKPFKEFIPYPVIVAHLVSSHASLLQNSLENGRDGARPSRISRKRPVLDNDRDDLRVVQGSFAKGSCANNYSTTPESKRQKLYQPMRRMPLTSSNCPSRLTMG